MSQAATYIVHDAPAGKPAEGGGAAAEIDSATLGLCRVGNAAAVRAFIVRYQVLVFAFLSRATGAGAHVEDLAQEVFLRACRALPRFDESGPARTSTWVLTIASRVAIDARKKKRVPTQAFDASTEASIETSDATRTPATPETEQRRTEIGRAIAAAAGKLPNEQRDAFVLAEYHGLEMAEIARVLGVSEGTAKTRLFRAREKMRALLADIWEER